MNAAPRVTVIRSNISVCHLSDSLALIESRLRSGEGGYVCFTNVHTLVMGRQNPDFRRITNESYLSVADGKPVYWVGRLKGAAIGHVPGPDFFGAAIRRFAHRRHFFYGSTPQTLAKLEANLRRQVPDLQVCGSLSPPFRPMSAEDKVSHYAAIRDSKADFVWVGLGAPKQEQWMAEAWLHLKPSLLFGVGAAFDFHAGNVRRAPRVLGHMGLEWLYRFFQEPRRMWRRYLVTNSLFCAYLLRDLLGAERMPRSQQW